MLTDHKQNFEVIENDLDQAIEKLSDYKIIMLTDDVTNNMLQNKNIVLLDDIIVNNFSKEFLSLPNHSEIAYGLVSALILVYSKSFIGTFGSTFSGYIHRERNKIQNETFDFIGMPSFGVGTPYSWNLEDYEGWSGMVREWPESKLSV